MKILTRFAKFQQNERIKIYFLYLNKNSKFNLPNHEIYCIEHPVA